MKGLLLDERKSLPEKLLPFNANGEELVHVRKIKDCLKILQRDIVDFIIIHADLLKKLGTRTCTNFMEATFYIPTVVIGPKGHLLEDAREILKKRILLQFSGDNPEDIKAGLGKAFQKKEAADGLQALSFRLRVLNILGV